MFGPDNLNLRLAAAGGNSANHNNNFNINTAGFNNFNTSAVGIDLDPTAVCYERLNPDTIAAHVEVCRSAVCHRACMDFLRSEFHTPCRSPGRLCLACRSS